MLIKELLLLEVNLVILVISNSLKGCQISRIKLKVGIYRPN